MKDGTQLLISLPFTFPYLKEIPIAGLSEIFSHQANQQLWLFSYDVAVNNTVDFQWLEH